MALHLEIPQTNSTPYVLVDEEQGLMKLEGRSYHENMYDFYSDVFTWLDGYLNTDFEAFTFECRLIYFNSSTTKLLLDMLKLLDDAAAEGKKIVVNWATDEENDIMIECAEDFQEELSSLTFNLLLE